MLSSAFMTNGPTSNGVSPTDRKSKDDSCAQTRTRHPTDRGRATPGLSKHFMILDVSGATESRSRAYSANCRLPAAANANSPRTNVYKRLDQSATPSPTRPPSATPANASGTQMASGASAVDGESDNNHAQKTPTSSSQNGLENGISAQDSPRSPMKRESWLQKSWRAAHQHRVSHSTQNVGPGQSQENGSLHCIGEHPPVALTISSPSCTMQTPETGRKSPFAVSKNTSAFGGFFDRLRPRAGSDTAHLAMVGQMVAAKRKKAAVSSEAAMCKEPEQAGEQKSLLTAQHLHTHDRRDSSPCASFRDRLDAEPPSRDDSFFDEAPVRRKRSNSDTTNFLIMRKTSRPNTNEVVGSLSRNDYAYKQLLKKFTCYDLMPTQGALVAVDSKLSTRQALSSLAENGVRAALIWDSRQRAPICLLTVTDLLRIMFAYFASPTGAQQHEKLSPRSPTVESADILQQPILSNLIRAAKATPSKLSKRCLLTTVDAEDTLHSALTILRLNRLHRVPVADTETGNPLYLLSSKRLLHFLYNHMTNLPMPPTMYKPLDELRVGTWVSDSTTLISVTKDITLIGAVEKFLDSGASSLPVIERQVKDSKEKPATRLIDLVTKVDLMHFVLCNGWNDLTDKTVADVLTARHSVMESLVKCDRKTPLILAMDRLVQSNAHRIYIVDSTGALEGLLSVGDLLSFLME